MRSRRAGVCQPRRDPAWTYWIERSRGSSRRHRRSPVAGGRSSRRRGWVIRAYGVEDDPKQPIEDATWFNRPILETSRRLGIKADEVWDGGRSGADVMECGAVPRDHARRGWRCARWMMGYASGYELSELADGAATLAGRKRCDVPTGRRWPKRATTACRASGTIRRWNWLSPAPTCGRCWRTCQVWRLLPRPGVCLRARAERDAQGNPKRI